MQFIEISQCKKIDFKPLKMWPAHLPPICTGNDVIAGFHSTHTVAVQVDGSFEHVLKDCYPTLTLSELARVYELKPNSDWQTICDCYGLRWTTDIQTMFENLILAPTVFQNWVSQKELGLKDLSVLRIADINQVRPLLEKICELDCSKHVGCKILEWSIELLSKYSVERVMEKSSTMEAWHSDLFQLKFPMTAGKDAEFSARVVRTPWPRQVDASWKRKGDMAGIEVRFTSLNSSDFQQKTEALLKLQSNVEKIWNPN